MMMEVREAVKRVVDKLEGATQRGILGAFRKKGHR